MMAGEGSDAGPTADQVQRGVKRPRSELEGTAAEDKLLEECRSALDKARDSCDPLVFQLTEQLLARVAWPTETCKTRFTELAVAASRKPQLSQDASKNAIPAASFNGKANEEAKGRSRSGSPAPNEEQQPRNLVRSSPALFDAEELEQFKAQALSLGQSWESFYPPSTPGQRPFEKVSFTDTTQCLAFRDLMLNFDRTVKTRLAEKVERAGKKGKTVVRDDTPGRIGAGRGAGKHADKVDAITPQDFGDNFGPDSPAILREEDEEGSKQKQADDRLFSDNLMNQDPDFVPPIYNTDDIDSNELESRTFTIQQADMIASLEALRPEIPHGKVIRILDRAGWNLENAGALLFMVGTEVEKEEEEEEENDENEKENQDNEGREDSEAEQHGDGQHGADGAQGHQPAGVAPTSPAAPRSPIAPPQPQHPQIPPPSPLNNLPLDLPPDLRAFYSLFPVLPVQRLSQTLQMACNSIPFATEIIRAELRSPESRPLVLDYVKKRLAQVAVVAMDDEVIWSVFEEFGDVERTVQMCVEFVN